MGYETELILNVTVPVKRLAAFKRALKHKQEDPNDEAAYMFQQLAVSEDRTVEFHGDEDSPGKLEPAEVPDEEEGLVKTVYFNGLEHGKWYHADELATWLCAQGCSGTIIQHSREGDGEAWGWEFRGGRIRTLSLQPDSDWVEVKPEPEAPPAPRRAGRRKKSG